MKQTLDLSDSRKSYQKDVLKEDMLLDDPMQTFLLWFKLAQKTPMQNECNAFTLTTLGLDGFPRSRVVLLKQVLENGFLFFTNYNSNKGLAINENPKVGLNFFWPELEKQIIIGGIAKKTSTQISDEYFQKRPFKSKISAWVSEQSKPIDSRSILEKKQIKLEKQYQEKEVPRPPHWGGYIITAEIIEFWQGRPNRLHDRFLYTKIEDSWKKTRLAP